MNVVCFLAFVRLRLPLFRSTPLTEPRTQPKNRSTNGVRRPTNTAESRLKQPLHRPCNEPHHIRREPPNQHDILQQSSRRGNPPRQRRSSRRHRRRPLSRTRRHSAQQSRRNEHPGRTIRHYLPHPSSHRQKCRCPRHHLLLAVPTILCQIAILFFWREHRRKHPCQQQLAQQ